jgi:excisionase family DNA binding protein
VDGQPETRAADATLIRSASPRRRKDEMPEDRFLTLSDVADVLNISASQTYALVRSGALPAIKIGGRGQWRVEREQLESYIERMYEQTRRFVEAHPLGRDEPLPPD